MNVPAFRAAAAVFVVGLLVVWLIRPVGNPCPDVDKLPAGSEGSSAPSFAPPLTRTCTYTTPEGTQARRRYVPVLDLVALLFVAGLAGGVIAVAGPGRGGSRPVHAARVRDSEPEHERERDTEARERARREREARRRG